MQEGDVVMEKQVKGDEVRGEGGKSGPEIVTA